MRAVVCRRLGTPADLSFEEMAEPQPAEGQVQVEMQAMGLNFVDVLMVAGGYQLKPELPFIPGLEGAGVVRKVGKRVT